MKHQQVSVDFWAMGKAMAMYAFLTAMAWLMFRMFNTVFMLPRRFRNQHDNIQNSLAELQKRYPNLNITEEDLKNAEKELEEFLKEEDEKEKAEKEQEGKKDQEKIEDKDNTTETPQPTEDKKTI